MLLYINKIKSPAKAINVSIIMVSVAPEIAFRIFEASINLDIISPVLRVPKEFIGKSIT